MGTRKRGRRNRPAPAFTHRSSRRTRRGVPTVTAAPRKETWGQRQARDPSHGELGVAGSAAGDAVESAELSMSDVVYIGMTDVLAYRKRHTSSIGFEESCDYKSVPKLRQKTVRARVRARGFEPPPPEGTGT
jgi:hypothetical protein